MAAAGASGRDCLIVENNVLSLLADEFAQIGSLVDAEMPSDTEPTKFHG